MPENEAPASRTVRRKDRASPDGPRVVGWREWVSLPALGVGAIKAKLDTGARTSALHAWGIEPHEIEGRPWVRFRTHPIQHDDMTVVLCAAPLTTRRLVMNSGGTRERRYVIATSLRLGDETWQIELTLTNRDEMGFRMLIGREAMHGRLIVDPRTSYRASKPHKKKTPSRETTAPGTSRRRRR